MRDSDESSERPLIIFDTNVLESRYIAPLLRGEAVRDFASLRASGYAPAVAIKSVREILYHVKKGDPVLPWMDPAVGYPGGIEEGMRILQREPELASRENLFCWFGLCEEWRGLDWEAERELVRRYVRPEERCAALRHVAIREEFCAWKSRLTAFCDRVDEAIHREMHVVDRCSLDRLSLPSLSLFDELSRSCIIPNEDLEIVASALAAKADAFVTADRDVLLQAGLSLSLNYRTAFVHPDQLREAISGGLDVRWSYTQTQPRDRGAGLAG